MSKRRKVFKCHAKLMDSKQYAYTAFSRIRKTFSIQFPFATDTLLESRGPLRAKAKNAQRLQEFCNFKAPTARLDILNGRNTLTNNVLSPGYVPA
jgi:hypothetical protein